MATRTLQHALLAYTVNKREYKTTSFGRERISINDGWRFWRSETNPDGITYDNRTDIPQTNSKHYTIPSSAPNVSVPHVANTFDYGAWEAVTLPHDWAIKGPYYVGDPTPITGGMARLPSQGVAYYRRKTSVSGADAGKVTYLDIDGAISYAMVLLNGNLVGGWPYGYNSFRLDLTPYLKLGDDNQLAVRLDNPIDSSRWYPGPGLYRNVWLTKVEPTHIGHWGTFISTKDVSQNSATIVISVQIESKSNATGDLAIVTDIWGPMPLQKSNMYAAVTRLVSSDNKTIYDTYTTPFRIRSFTYSGSEGLSINGEHLRVQGVNEHCHDLGALGSAWNDRAAERKLEHLRDLGVNAIRMAHNPPAPELLELCDRMGFILMDEIFDCWEQKKTDNDFHLIFPAWHEAGLRAFIRRDRNHPSIFAWSVGNEVGEQTCCANRGYEIGRMLNDIVKSEDPTRPVTASMNVAKPDMTFPEAFDILHLNYQDEGIRDTPQYAWTNGTRTPPQYQPFHDKFPTKMLAESESAAALSSRGTYLFPVTELISAPVNNSNGGGNSTLYYVNSYELHSANFGSAADKVFAEQDAHPFVAGEFVCEPEPYYSARSSYFGIIDLAGFPKDRYYLYQSCWRPDLKIAHILPHWNFPDHIGKVTPVHVFTNGNEAELFVNDVSQGRKTLGTGEYRFRWNDVVYQPGSVRVVTYKNGTEWATSSVRTTGAVASLRLTPDRQQIAADGADLSFITVEIVDANGDVVRNANDAITFSIEGPGEIVATDNGFEADFVPFASTQRNAFNGFALAIVKAKKEGKGRIKITATAAGSKIASAMVRTK
ncbi:glycoside hydrolase [Setomelanomma holmii]|uniref:Glycoside hydrolase n=1 Tax=Setomelanomma holmii TaxID=210430 RepID=A0A9P4HDJ3_9PLEO|nr:glycoside hydrolase [Setomelanomma holmii]